MNITTITKACRDCTFWNPAEDEHGECRRHAPLTVSFHVDAELHFESMFPATDAEDWCGDFEKE